MKYLIFSFLIFCSLNNVIGQEFEGRIELYGDRYIESKSITLNENANFITFNSNLNYELKDFNKSRIRSIQKRKGSYFVVGLVAGAISSPLLYHFVIGYDNFNIDSFMATNLLGMTIGSVFGFLTNRYTQIYGELDTRLAVFDKIEIMLGTYQYKVNVLSLNLNIE